MGGVENEELALWERLLKSLQRVAGAAEGSLHLGFHLKTLLALPHRQHSVKKNTQKTHPPKHELASMHREVDDFQMEMHTKVSPTILQSQ